MKRLILVGAGLVLMAGSALAQAPAPTMNPNTRDAVGGNSSQLDKPTPNQGQTSGGPSTRGGMAGPNTTGTVGQAPMQDGKSDTGTMQKR